MAALRRFSIVQLVGRGGRIRLLSVWRAYSNGTPFSSLPGKPIKEKLVKWWSVNHCQTQQIMILISRFVFWTYLAVHLSLNLCGLSLFNMLALQILPVYKLWPQIFGANIDII